MLSAALSSRILLLSIPERLSNNLRGRASINRDMASMLVLIAVAMDLVSLSSSTSYLTTFDRRKTPFVSECVLTTGAGEVFLCSE